jgi:hypothetical protein
MSDSPQVVLPGSAYMAIAIKALPQLQDLKDRLMEREATSFESRNINISTATASTEDDDAVVLCTIVGPIRGVF